MENKTIWTLMAMEKTKVDEKGWPQHGNTWVVGFWFSRDAALEALKNYARLIEYEGYNYVVMEEYEEGISGNVIDATAWFQWNAATSQFSAIEEPQHEHMFCGYVMG